MSKVLNMAESISKGVNEAGFIDAQQMHKDHPETFEVPSKEELDAIKPGDNVKVCVNDQERFWVLVTEVNGDKITGMVNNKLLGDYGFDYEDTIKVLKRNVYSILPKGKNESKNFVELAEKAYLVKSLKEQKELSEQEQAFIVEVEGIKLTEAEREAVMKEYEKIRGKE